MRILLALLVLSACGGPQAQADGGGSQLCVLEDGEFVLDLGRTKTPTYAAVVLPSGKVMQLRHAPEGIDTLGQNYDRGHLRLPIRALTGVVDDQKPQQVFTEPGTYRFLMQDANTAEGMDLHRLQCEVAFSPERDLSGGT